MTRKDLGRPPCDACFFGGGAWHAWMKKQQTRPLHEHWIGPYSREGLTRLVLFVLFVQTEILLRAPQDL